MTNNISNIIKREFCRNALKCIPKEEQKAAFLFENFILFPTMLPSIIIFILVNKGLAFRFCISFITILALTAAFKVKEQFFSAPKENPNFPYKREWTVSFLRFTLVSNICLFIAMLLIILNLYSDIISAEVLAFLFLWFSALLFNIRYLVFSVVPTLKELKSKEKSNSN